VRRDLSLFWLPTAIFLAICAFETVLILHLNESHFTYTLDDPYIHLAMAENLARGHYGVNEGEFSAPSSTIMWPLLLTPFARAAVDHFVPLIINLIVSVGIIFLFGRIVVAALPARETRASGAVLGLLVLLLIVGTNVVGLAFTGMEHSLQLFFVAWILYGLAREAASSAVPRWLPIAIVGAPLVRFENLAVALPALALLLVRRHVRTALFSGAILFLALVGFALFLHSMGLGYVPSSVVAKSNPVATGGTLRSLAGNVRLGLATRQGGLLGVAWLLLGVGLFQRKRSSARGIAGVALSAVSLHFVMGRFGWYNRYELYVWGAALLSLMLLYRDWLQRLVVPGRGISTMALPLGLIGIASAPYLFGLVTVPLAANNIFQQQYQMHRFITEYYRAPVAVNDLGWVSYRNDDYVLDLWGLASRQALDQRRAGGTSDWIRDLTERHEVKLAMVYAAWFPDLPEDWKEIGSLTIGRKLISAARRVVTFYAVDAQTHAHASSLLLEYRKTLPRGVRFEFVGEEGRE
jgi:hypothetical protein